YTHPFKTLSFGEAIQLFSFSDYERWFGGLYASGIFDANVAYAVNQFFLNGGSVPFVVGLRAKYLTGGAPVAVTPPALTPGRTVFAGREPTDLVPMAVTIDNISGSRGDVTITYGNSIETFRGVSTSSADPTFVENVLGTTAQPRSNLVTVTPGGGG